MTGAAASYGLSVAQGPELAVGEVNALGGVQLELNVQDDEHDPEMSVNAYKHPVGLGRADDHRHRHHLPVHRGGFRGF